MRIIIVPQAEEDITTHTNYLSLHASEQAAATFTLALRAAFQLLADMPLVGTANKFPRRKLSTLRMWPLPNSSEYIIFYEPTAAGIKVARVVHAKQDYHRVVK